MELVFFSNYLNHHQAHLMNEFYDLLGDEFSFVATLPRNEKELKGGEDYSFYSYCILAGESESAHQKALQLACEAEVCVFGACSQEYAVARACHNKSGISFEMSERWLKRGWVNVLSPTFLKWYLNYIRFYRHRPFYKLCCSAYTSIDDNKVWAYRGRHYRWGYFTEVQQSDNIAPLNIDKTDDVKIMWCARFLHLKHPEIIIYLAERLNNADYHVQIDMYGDGEYLEYTKSLCRELNVENIVRFVGNVSNEDILTAMSEHDIFLFTSDRNEGWGVVVNEAMSHHCVVVASDAVGSAPFLIKDGNNGLLFKSGHLDSLYERVTYLINHPGQRLRMAENAYQDMVDIWSPRKAASNLIQLINDLKCGNTSSIAEGPCSKI